MSPVPAPAHDHVFGQDRRRPGETRTLVVVVVTAAMMAIEIVAGLFFGSMALLADGLHMGSHAVALGISVFAYIYARRHAFDGRFNFGTGKVNSLSGFASAMLLALFALVMIWESGVRFFHPVAIAFNQAILVAALGLLVNGVSVWILGVEGHGHEEEVHSHDGKMHVHHHEHGHGHDHNLRSAYLHVLADALTSVLAIVALCSGKYLGWNWMDPVMGMVGGVMVAIWAKSLIASTARVLLDMRIAPALTEAVRECLEHDGRTRVTDLHLWNIGPGIHAATIAIATPAPQSPEQYRQRIPEATGIVHSTIEVNGPAEE